MSSVRGCKQVELREGQPWHAEHPFYNHWCQLYTHFETLRWGMPQPCGPRTLMDWFPSHQLVEAGEKHHEQGAASKHAALRDERPPPQSLLGSLATWLLTEILVSITHLFDRLTEGRPGPRRLFDTIESLHVRPKVRYRHPDHPLLMMLWLQPSTAAACTMNLSSRGSSSSSSNCARQRGRRWSASSGSPTW